MRGYFEIRNILIKSPDHTVKFWVCDYLQNSGIGKVLRNIKPIYVEISIADHMLDGVLNKQYDFMPQVKEVKIEKASNKKIAYYSTIRGDEGLYFFKTEKEAIEKYNDLIFKNIKSIESEKERSIKQFDLTISKLQESFIQSDYVMECLVRSHKQN